MWVTTMSSFIKVVEPLGNKDFVLDCKLLLWCIALFGVYDTCKGFSFIDVFPRTLSPIKYVFFFSLFINLALVVFVVYSIIFDTYDHRNSFSYID